MPQACDLGLESAERFGDEVFDPFSPSAAV